VRKRLVLDLVILVKGRSSSSSTPLGDRLIERLQVGELLIAKGSGWDFRVVVTHDEIFGQVRDIAVDNELGARR
jgi:hypothetical protein